MGKVQVDSNSQINRNVACYVKTIMRPIGSTELNGHCEIFFKYIFIFEGDSTSWGKAEREGDRGSEVGFVLTALHGAQTHEL